VTGPPDVSGIILAGGASRRMGADKALLEIEGRALLVVLAARLRPIVSEVVIVGPERELADIDARFVHDDYPGEGPLGGLISGLRRITFGVGLVVGCDMPLLSLRTCRTLIQAWSPTCDGVVARIDGNPQPLLALYSVRSVPGLESSFARGIRSIRRPLRDIDVTWLDVSDTDETASFMSIDTPEEWQQFMASRDSSGSIDE
jgi:molybdopterin-guanine dinucleotide biosynthesis protein A